MLTSLGRKLISGKIESKQGFCSLFLMRGDRSMWKFLIVEDMTSFHLEAGKALQAHCGRAWIYIPEEASAEQQVQSLPAFLGLTAPLQACLPLSCHARVLSIQSCLVQATLRCFWACCLLSLLSAPGNQLQPFAQVPFLSPKANGESFPSKSFPSLPWSQSHRSGRHRGWAHVLRMALLPQLRPHQRAEKMLLSMTS